MAKLVTVFWLQNARDTMYTALVVLNKSKQMHSNIETKMHAAANMHACTYMHLDRPNL